MHRAIYDEKERNCSGKQSARETSAELKIGERMCGICGFISKNRITNDQLKAMNDTMYHRGPDDGGAEIYDAMGRFCVGLAQRRLSILDLSPLGHQPMHSPNGRLSIVNLSHIKILRCRRLVDCRSRW